MGHRTGAGPLEDNGWAGEAWEAAAPDAGYGSMRPVLMA